MEFAACWIFVLLQSLRLTVAECNGWVVSESDGSKRNRFLLPKLSPFYKSYGHPAHALKAVKVLESSIRSLFLALSLSTAFIATTRLFITLLNNGKQQVIWPQKSLLIRLKKPSSPVLASAAVSPPGVGGTSPASALLVCAVVSAVVVGVGDLLDLAAVPTSLPSPLALASAVELFLVDLGSLPLLEALAVPLSSFGSTSPGVLVSTSDQVLAASTCAVVKFLKSRGESVKAKRQAGDKLTSGRRFSR